MKSLLLLLLLCPRARAAEEKIRFLPMQSVVTCAGDCEEYDKFLGEQSLVFERNEQFSSGHATWALAADGHFYRAEFFYQDYPHSRYYHVVVYAGREDDPRKMARGEASFASTAMPETVTVQAPNESGSFGLTLTSLELPAFP